MGTKMPGLSSNFAKVLYDFTPSDPAEIPLLVGDILLVEKIVDDFWYFGKNLNDEKTGQFPKDFVTFTQPPVAKPPDTLHFALDTFFPETKEDLPFQKGDIIILETKIDESWARGRCHNRHGMFPLNYTMQLPQSRLKNANKGSTQVKATMPLTAQIEGELSFNIGDIITITKLTGDGFAEGTLEGKTGAFPLSFTTPISVQNGLQTNAQTILQRTGDKSWKYEPQRNEDDMRTTHNATQGEDNNGNEMVVPNQPEYRDKNTDSNGAAQNQVTYAKFSYKRRNSSELSFNEGDVIEVIEDTSEMWLYGKVHGSFGYAPRSYVSTRLSNLAEQFDDETPLVQVEKKQKAKKCISDAISAKKSVDVRRVVKEFIAGTDFEVSILVGENVKVFNVNGDWCDVETGFGKTGFVPTNCLQKLATNDLKKDSYSPVTYSVSNAQPKQSPLYSDQTPQILKPTPQNLHPTPQILKPKEQYSNPTSQNRNPNFNSNPHSSNLNQQNYNFSSNPQTFIPIAHNSNPNITPTPQNFDSGTYRVKKRSDSKPQIKATHPVQPPTEGDKLKGISRSSHVNEKSLQKFRHFSSLTSLPPRTELNKTGKNSSIHRSLSLHLGTPQQTIHSHSSSVGEIPRNSPMTSSSRSDTNSTCSSDSTKSAPLYMAPPKVAPHRVKTQRNNEEILSAFDPLQNETPPELPIRTTSCKKATRSAPPPPQSYPANKSSPKHLSPPKRPPPPVSKVRRVRTEISEEQKQRIEKIRLDIEEYCRMKKELENLYNSTLDGAKRREIAENKQFVISKLTRRQKELETVMGEHLYESVDDYMKEPESTKRPPTPPPVEQVADMKNKRAMKRKHVMREIVETEKDFLQDITIAIDDIMEPLIEHELPPDIRIDTLFGNIEDIKAFSADFLAALHAVPDFPAKGGRNIGKVFTEFSPRMKEVYKIYCRNHDDATALLEKCEDDREFQVLVQECLNNAKTKVNTFDLGSFLIKPVQRMLKYPLLLRELLKLTDQDVPDDSHKDLIEALKMMQNVANEINEDKRKKDLVRKYRRGSQETNLTGKISRFSIHSVRKKTARISRRLGHVTGIGQSETVDEKFNAQEKRFKELERAVKAFLQNIELVCTKFRDTLASELLLAEDVYDFYSSNHTESVKMYAVLSRKISEQLYRQFHDKVQLTVASPLSSLLVRCKGPQALMVKRFDKLLDYELCQKNSDAKEKTQMARNVYDALNHQLQDELPILHSLGIKLLQTCVAAFVQLQANFHRKVLKELQLVHQTVGFASLNEKTDCASLDSTDLMETFNVEHSEIVVDVAHFLIVPASFGALMSPTPRAMERKRPSVKTVQAQQSTQHRDQILSKYADTVHVCIRPHHPTHQIELGVNTGDLVGVIKQQDPMGNTGRWFVDDGASQGLIPSSILHLYTRETTSTPNSPQITLQRSGVTNQSFTALTPSPKPRRRTGSPTPSASSSEMGAMSFGAETTPLGESPRTNTSPYHLRESIYDSVGYGEIPENVLAEVFDEESEMMDETEYGEVTHENKEHYRAEYAFQARNDLELTITEGEMLILLAKHDLENNSEWWLVSNGRSQQGYVPFNYLTKAEYL